MTIRSMSRRTFALTAAAGPLLAGVAGAQSATRAERSHAAAAAVVAKLHATSSPPALSLAVARPTGLVWAAAFGKANLESGVDTTPAHRFRLGSVSKTVTAVAAAELVARGVIDLDAPISTWLPDLPKHHLSTTMKQLLTHRGGVRHYTDRDLDPLAPGGAIFQRVYRNNQDILSVFIDDPLVAEKGTQVYYSSFGFTLASIIMEMAAGRPFVPLIKSSIGDRFGLDSLVEDDPFTITPGRVAGYTDAKDIGRVSPSAAAVWYAQRTGGWSNIPAVNPAYGWAAGGFLMTPADIARFGAAMLDAPNSRLSGEERRLLFTPLTPAPSLGLAWRIDADARGRRRWHHAGATLGGRASVVVYPDLGLSVAIASNVMTLPADVLGPSSELADAFA